MNLYLISQEANDNCDTYDSAVVAAESEEAARMIHPSSIWEELGTNWDGKSNDYDSWVNADQVSVQLIGMAKEGTQASVICASFNAG